jgi:3-deoxy-D-manno-octulosonic-acid transferase
MYFLYTLLGLLYCVLLLPPLFYEAVRYKKYIGTLRQRVGYLPVSLNVDGEDSVWIHAVSVGEVLTARALIGDVRRLYPRLRLFLSTTTIAGQQVARASVPGVDAVFYFPIEHPIVVRRLLGIVRPRLFVMMETEIWPNLLRECRRTGVKTVLVNGRISARSFPRYRLVRAFFRGVLRDIDHCCVQSAETRDRLLQLGADPARITVTGSLKFDSLPPSSGRQGRGADRVLRFFDVGPDRPVIIAGSTLRGEEAAVLRVFDRLRDVANHALLIIAPRHPERFAEVERLALEAGFDTVRRTDLPIDNGPRAEVVVLDTIGELAQLYQVATIVFVGGSLVPAGGHNILEPAIFGKPILFGPHMDNFTEIADAFLQSGAGIQVGSEAELEAVLRRLLAQPDERRRLGDAARGVVEANRGAKDKSLQVIADLLPPESVGAPVSVLRVVR